MARVFAMYTCYVYIRPVDVSIACSASLAPSDCPNKRHDKMNHERTPEVFLRDSSYLDAGIRYRGLVGEGFGGVNVLPCTYFGHVLGSSGRVALLQAVSTSVSRHDAPVVLTSPMSCIARVPVFPHSSPFSFSEHVLIVRQAEPILDIMRRQPVQRRLQVIRREGNLLHPRMDPLVGSKLQHL